MANGNRAPRSTRAGGKVANTGTLKNAEASTSKQGGAANRSSRAPGQLTSENGPKGSRASNTARRAQHNGNVPRNKAALAGWLGGAVVIAVVIALVVVATTSGSSKVAAHAKPAPASVVAAVTHVPASALEKVGLGGTATITPPQVLKGQPPLMLDGKPEVYYEGAEYCPYCAATRWPLIVALSRFGTFKGLEEITSSLTDVYAGTNTFSFVHASYTSPYVAFVPMELCTNYPAKHPNTVAAQQCDGYQPLSHPTKAEAAIFAKYDFPPFVPSNAGGGIPFIDFGNKFMVSGAPYNPQYLHGFDWSEIASSLSDPSTPTAQRIDAAANYFTAAICELTKDKPASVCSEPVISRALAKIKATSSVSSAHSKVAS